MDALIQYIGTNVPVDHSLFVFLGSIILGVIITSGVYIYATKLIRKNCQRDEKGFYYLSKRKSKQMVAAGVGFMLGTILCVIVIVAVFGMPYLKAYTECKSANAKLVVEEIGSTERTVTICRHRPYLDKPYGEWTYQTEGWSL